MSNIQAKTMTVNHYTTSIDKDLCDRSLGLNPEGGKFPNHFGFKPNDLKEEERKKEKNQKKIKKEEEKENGRKNDMRNMNVRKSKADHLEDNGGNKVMS